MKTVRIVMLLVAVLVLETLRRIDAAVRLEILKGVLRDNKTNNLFFYR